MTVAMLGPRRRALSRSSYEYTSPLPTSGTEASLAQCAT
eukprot:CAMPEP_0185208732 /NCGR_PEP_ID=MMETSP1140-20130426/62519_1 /TAXON_ID=298111 /ORGANISM="Pavlova sp., Strain CCMP459" /LENGTH=38 /DNA_ID= /DNA_START= /DNA_END= /DNA_ORIENTATION=